MKLGIKLPSLFKKGFDSEPEFFNKYLETKIKYYDRKINTNFHDDKVPKEGSQYICLSVILIDSLFRTGIKILQVQKQNDV